MDPTTARRLWRVAEPCHAVTYFAPQSKAAWAAAGLRGFWRGYFATRAAPLGPVGPEVVTALFCGFAPGMVARALPEVWSMAPPADAWAARVAGAAAALEAGLGDDAAGPEVEEAAALAWRAVDAAPVAGRPLFAAHLPLDRPAEPHRSLWLALTLLREHRGDGHVAALVAAGVDGCASLVMAAAHGGAPRALTQPNRGWTDEEWGATVAALAERGLVDQAGGPTAAGAAVHRQVEDATDRAALPAYAALGEDGAARLHALLAPLAARVVAAGLVAYPNPMGAPPPGGVSPG
ncbi:MAG TPA: hypothetical protein VGB14_07425 [Acidimicrobiales bacterium]|jgi:hypothetical protein